MSEENNSGTTEASVDETEVVPFHEVSDEDLEAFLQAEEDVAEHGEDTGGEPETTSGNALTPQSANAPEKTDDENAPITRAEYNALLKKLENQGKKVDGQELLLHRRTSELGEVKKNLAAISEALQQKYQEALAESPADALDIRDAIKENRAQMKQVEDEEKRIARRAQTQEIVTSHVPQEDFDVDAIAETLARDGIPMQYVEAFKQDPIGFVDGDYSPGLMLVHVAKRAKAEKVLGQIFPIAKKLLERVKQLESKEGDVLNKIQRVAKQTPQITASGSRPSKNGKATSISESQLKDLTDEELDEILASAKN